MRHRRRVHCSLLPLLAIAQQLLLQQICLHCERREVFVPVVRSYDGCVTVAVCGQVDRLGHLLVHHRRTELAHKRMRNSDGMVRQSHLHVLRSECKLVSLQRSLDVLESLRAASRLLQNHRHIHVRRRRVRVVGAGDQLEQVQSSGDVLERGREVAGGQQEQRLVHVRMSRLVRIKAKHTLVDDDGALLEVDGLQALLRMVAGQRKSRVHIGRIHMHGSEHLMMHIQRLTQKLVRGAELTLRQECCAALEQVACVLTARQMRLDHGEDVQNVAHSERNRVLHSTRKNNNKRVKQEM